MVIPTVKSNPSFSDADTDDRSSDTDEDDGDRVEPEPFAKALPLSTWAKSCALPKKNSKMQLDCKIAPLMVLQPTTKIYVHYSKEDQMEDKVQPVTLWTRREPLDLFATTPSLPDIDLNAESKTARGSHFPGAFRLKPKPTAAELKAKGQPVQQFQRQPHQKTQGTHLENVTKVKVTHLRPPGAKVETRLSMAGSKPEDSKVGVSRSKAVSAPPAAKTESRFSKAGSGSTTLNPKAKDTHSRATSSTSGPSAKTKVTFSKGVVTTPSAKLSRATKTPVPASAKVETKPLRAPSATQGAKVEKRSRPPTASGTTAKLKDTRSRVQSTPPLTKAKAKVEVTRSRPLSTAPAGNLKELPSWAKSRSKSQLSRVKVNDDKGSRARSTTPSALPEVTDTPQPLKEATKPAKIKPFRVNSGTDIFSEYADIYHEIIEKDFGASSKQVGITEPRRSRAVSKVKVRPTVTPRTATPKSAVSSVPTTAATMGSSGIRSVGSSINGEFADSKPWFEYYPDPRSLTPLSTASTLSVASITRKIGGYDLKNAESLLPYWINRRTWNMRKLERQQRLDETAAKTGKRCTQIFPGGYYNQTQEDRVRQNERGWMYGGPRTVQSERELKLKRLWEQLDLAKSERTHIDIPYRQGSTVVLGFPGHGGLVDTDLDSTKTIPTTESEAELHSLKVGIYRHIASSNRKQELLKKRNEYERRMAAKECINDVCKSKADRIAEAKARGFLPGEVVNPPILEPWLTPDETKATVKRIGYKYSSYRPPTLLKSKSVSGTAKFKSNSKTTKVGKSEGADIKSFASLLAEPDYEATYFKMCPNCGKYVRHSDAATHATECCAAGGNKGNVQVLKRPSGGMSVNSYNSYTEQQRWLRRPGPSVLKN